MNDIRGSIWRKWDLHIHTPASLAQNYGGDNPAVWARFVAALEELPPAFKVIGVNDYIFLDGYKRLKAMKDEGRLANIDLLLPVIELRIDKFAGTDGHLRRVNYHVIFSDELRIELIEQQFINGLNSAYRLSPDHEDLRQLWRSIPTRESLKKLGELIIERTPSDQRSNLGNPLFLGFTNLNFSLDKIQSLLCDNPDFKGHFLTAVGKTEWDQLRWTSQSIAEKKTVINSVDAVFIAAESPERWQSARRTLQSNLVNARLIDCSDAHTYHDAETKDRLGNCFTWIKADTTFAGLKQALNEFDERVFVGDEPEQLRRVRENKTKHIRSVSIKKVPGSRLVENWFDFEIPLNHGLVAVIGNRGMGKSALADTLALLGESHSTRYSFLDNLHFRSPKDNKAKHFSGTLVWESGVSASRNLNETEPQSAVAMTRYVPQNLFEEICNEPPSSGRSAFGRELGDVIFSHVRPEDRMGLGTLDELIAFRISEAEADLDELRRGLKVENHRIATLERDTSVPNRVALEERIASKKEELRVHDESRPVEMQKPTADETIARDIEAKRAGLEHLESRIQSEQDDLAQLKIRQATLGQISSKLDRLAKQIESTERSLEQDLVGFHLNIHDLIRITIEREPIENLISVTESDIVAILARLVEEQGGSLLTEKRSLLNEITSLKAQLDGPALEFQRRLEDISSWHVKRKGIVGDISQPESLAFLESRLVRLTTEIPVELETRRTERERLMRAIFRGLKSLVGIYQQLYQPVQTFLDQHGWVRDELKLEFGVSLEVNQLEELLLGYINQGRRGAFHGVDEGRKRLRAMVQAVDFNDEEQVARFATGVLAAFETSGGLSSQLRDVRESQEVYDLLFGLGYIKPLYTLNVADRSLEKLSPGERGMLLLVFYLLVDQSDVPLIIDQPEENLDNQSVFRLLVPCLKEVRKRRQIILVTHNPNLAVVCDAEQVIHAFIDKDQGSRVIYTSGAIENPMINRHIIDVLEGTWPAFRNRSTKYNLFPPDTFSLPLTARIHVSASPVAELVELQEEEEIP